MKKRVITILIVLAALISLLVLPTNAAETSSTLQAGYHKITIDPYNHPDGPLTGLPMGGYGAVTERLSGTKPDTVGENLTIEFNTNARMDDNGDGKIDNKDGLFATCTAISDKNGNTIIHFGVDNTNASTSWTNGARFAIAKKLQDAGYGVSFNHIFITASHSHSTPQLTYSSSSYPEITARVKQYREWVISQMGDAAVAAMKDRVPVTLTKASVDASDAIGAMYSSASANQKRMNWVRHYKSYTSKYHALGVGDTYVGGSNFGGYASYDTSEVSAPNDVMQLVQFTPTSGSKDPILLVNWTAHATMNSSGGSSGYSTSTFGRYHHYNTSADYPGALRNALETATCYDSTIKSNYFSKVSSTQTYRVSFISGAAGNVTPSTSIMTDSQDPDVLATNTTIGYEDDPAGHLYGQKLAAVARYGLANKLETGLDNTGDLRVQTKTFTYDIQKATDFDTAFVNALKSYKVDANGNISDSGTKNLLSYLVTNSTTWAKKSDTAYTSLTYTYNNKTYDFTYLNKFTSRYQLSNLNGRVVDTNETGSMTVSAIAIGKNLAFTVNPCELADRFSTQATLSSTTLNDWDNLVDSSTYGTPLIMGYTNGAEGYVPNKLAYNYNSGSTSSGGDGADTSDKFITGSYESSGAEFAAGTGEQLVVFYKTMLNDLKNGTETTDGRFQCECGGKAVGKPGHTCAEIEFLPWTDGTSLPNSGCYYLDTDVVLEKEFYISNILCLDLNGHSITHKITEEEAAKIGTATDENTRVFSLSGNGHLTVTDSSSNPGTVTRDLSNLTADQKENISNYGLLFFISGEAEATVYDGIFDATGMYCGGGACVCTFSSDATFKMYGGTLKGGITNTGAVMYNRGHAEFYGGTVTGGVTKTTGGQCGGIYVIEHDGVCGTLTIGGDVVIKDNKKSNGNQVNIRFDKDSNMAANFIVKGAFTGEASFYYASTRSNGLVVGKSENASFTTANLHQDINKDFDVAVSGDDIILATVKNQCECGGKASGKTGHTCKKVDFVPWTSTTTLPSSGNYYLTDNVIITAQKNITGTLRLDLNGKNITHAVTAAEAAKIGTSSAHNTRVFATYNDGCLSITDSTTNPGTVTRDLSNLTETQKNSITNYGLLVLANSTKGVTIYNGIFDSTGAYTGGNTSGYTNGSGACFSSMHADGTLTIYGGEIKGGISNRGGLIGAYSGTTAIYGGTLTGGDTKSAGAHCGGIYVYENATLILGGTAVIDDNLKYVSDTTDTEVNIRFANESKLATNFIVSGEFTGKAGIYVGSRSDGLKIGISDNASFTAENIYLDYYTDGKYDIALSGNNIVLAAPKTQCECGGKAVGKYGHTCENLTWKPWNSSSALPTEEGNYYLTTDVTTTAQKGISAAIRIDLNGHDITHKVKAGATNTRVFYINAGGSLVITDSTANPGKVTRDLSNLTTAQKEAITNYGLIVMISTSTESGGFTLYNGTLDASGMYTYGGAVTCLNSVSPIKIYGGTINGGIANTSSTDGGSGYSGGVFTWGPLEIHGGTITGSTATRTSGGGGVYFTKSLLLTGDPTITGNVDANGNAYNVCSVAASKITVSGTFTGTVGFNKTAPAADAQVAKSSNAVITNATLSIDNYPSYSIAVSGNYLVMRSAYTASITVGENVTYVDTLNNAINQYPGGDAVLTVLQDSNENVTFTQDTILDLNGCNLTGTVTANGKLTVKDSQTDDLTISDAAGYGKLPASLSAAAADDYIMISEDDGISFHKLILKTVGINLRSSTAGMYYTSDFGGDEVIKRNIKSFGIALGANSEPDFRDKTYTAFSNSDWVVGINADGSTKNRSNGTILRDILSTENGYSVNKNNAATQVWGVAYIDLLDGTRITEDNTVKFSLRNIIEGYTGFDGADDLWEDLNDTQKSEAVAMYKTYEKVMKNWDIPNIKQALIDGQDDGVLKILMIGHSLGMDSTYFVPEVLKNETGENVVVGTLYHSGCRLNQHVDYLQRDAEEYAYLEYDTSTDTAWRIWETEEGQNKFVTHTPNQAHDSYIGAAAATAGNANKYGVTMQWAIQQHDWDIVVMQAGVFEAANGDDSTVYSPNIAADIKTIQDYVKANDANKYTAPKFAWNMTWATPSADFSKINTSYKNYLNNLFSGDYMAMYNAISKTLTDVVLPTHEWAYVFPSGTVVENARTIYTGTNQDKIYRDTIHGTDLIRLAVAYTWYCELFDKDISECGFDPISNALRFQTADRNTGEDYTLTTDEKGYVKDFVRNAMTNPYEVTQIKEPEDVLKVLVVGHSTGMDPIYFVPEIAEANGVKMIVGDLYHSGCKLSQHESFIKNNREAYVYLEYDNTSDKNYWEIWQTGVDKVKSDGTVEALDEGFARHIPNQAHDSWYYGSGMTMLSNSYGVTMQWAIQQHDWDIVIMMGGRLETTDIFTDGEPLDITDIGIIRDYILDNDIDKTTVPDFAWNTLWTNPEYDEDWIATLSSSHQSSYKKNWTAVQNYYDNSTTCLYEHLVAGLKNHILPAYNFDYLLHNNTVIQKAKAMGLTNAEIYRDYTHGTDFTRMMTAANWYCGITGTDIDDLVIPSIPAILRFKTADRNSGEVFTLTSDELTTLKACVRNALESPYEITN